MIDDRFRHRILSHISDRRYRPADARALAEELGVAGDQWPEFNRSVQRLVEDGEVVLGAADAIALPPPGREMTGVFRLSERGFGFIVPDGGVAHGDLFVPAGQTAGALSGDRVRAKVIHEPRRAGGGRSPFTGRIVEIVQRADRRYVGNLRKRGSQFVVEIDGTVLREPVLVRDPHAKNARIGDKVVVELVEFPSEYHPGEGVITEVLGEQGEPDVETRAVMRAFGLAEGFPEEVLEDARAAARSIDDHTIPAGREDLTGTFILTIDPPDARDYDDAISLRKLDGQHDDAVWELGVHIAHVSHFVRSGSALDQEARARGNSTYLPRRVVPMLPELLSNGVCSLQEGVNRFCLSAFMRYDADGNVLGQRFSRSVIRSAKRLTYLEAQALIDGDLREAVKHAKTEPRYPRPLLEALKNMNSLAKTIRERRLKQGMIVLGLPDVELVFDESGRVTDAVPEDNAFTHTLIEMFMVEANEAAARLFDSFNVPMIRRIHADPPSHDLTELRQFARVAGFNIPAHPSRKELQQLLDGVRGQPAQHAVHLAVLQTLSRAEYSPALIGHFALASEHYTHFTSPIRRYPDLIVHRGIDAYLDLRQPEGGKTGGGKAEGGRERDALARQLRSDPRLPGEQELFDLGRACSNTERNSASAERELRTYLVLDLLASHLGEDYDGTVTGVTAQGVFVQLDRYLVDGFIRLDDLPGQAADTWRLNRTTGALVAQRSGKTITIGDRFLVRLAKVNPARRKMELVIVSEPGAAPKPRKRTPPPGASKAHQQTARIKQQRRKDRRKRRRP